MCVYIADLYGSDGHDLEIVRSAYNVFIADSIHH